MELKQYIVNAFAEGGYRGNPAAVCLLPVMPDADAMLNLARRNAFSETAFCVESSGKHPLRWFTPGGEIDLCGHATLATAFVMRELRRVQSSPLVFATRSGELSVTPEGDRFKLALPAYRLTPAEVTTELVDLLGVEPLEAFMGRDLLCILESEAAVRNFAPDPVKARELPGLLLHVSARGSGEFDCVSRSFGYKLGVPEDPVCGSGHCHIVPYWAEKLNKRELLAHQASERGGVLHCEVSGSRVILGGKAVLAAVTEATL